MKKNILLLCAFTSAYLFSVAQQNIGINVPTPLESLHVDSSIKIGKNTSLSISTPGRTNLLKFGDQNFVTLGEELTDDKLYMRYGDMVFLKSTGSLGNGFIGINTEMPTAQLDINGSLRIRNAAGTGKILTSDINGNASWQFPATNNISFSSYLTTNHPYTAGNYEPTAFTEYHDDGNNFNPATGEFTIPSGGLYQFIAHGGWISFTTGSTVALSARINVATVGGGSYSITSSAVTPGLSSYPYGVDVTFIRKFNTGDKLNVEFSHNSAASITLSGGTGSGNTTFSGFKIY